VGNTQSIRIREAVEADAEAVARVLFEAIHGSASQHYSSEVIASWARSPDEPRCTQIRRAIVGTDELCLVAEHAGEVVGAILHDLERMAVARGLSELHMDASLNAEVFYLGHGYEVIGRGEHRLANGPQMACVKMRKALPEDQRR
jgi:putative acetyltransferase